MSVIGNRLLWANRIRVATLTATKLYSQKSSIQALTPLLNSKLLTPQTLRFDSIIQNNYSTANEDLKKKFDALVKDKDIVVFMKGRCYSFFLW